MNIDIRTLVFVLGITHFIQVFVFFLQYKINKNYSGIGWWLLWSATEVLGFSCMLLRTLPACASLAIITQNALIILGTIFLYIGVLRFLDKKENQTIIISLYLGYIASLVYFLYVDNNITVRSVMVNAALATISFLTAQALFVHKPRSIAVSIHFNTVFFLIHGAIFTFRTGMICAGTPMNDFFTPTLFNYLPYLDALIVSLLWTFGFIIMINQRLNAEMTEAKNHFEMIFNMSPDGVLITQMGNGLIVDINEGLRVITGFSRQESIGKSTAEMPIWKNPSDYARIVSELHHKGFCENHEVTFLRKDGAQVIGLLSSKIILLKETQHVISVIRDISERKRAEEHIEMLSRAIEQCSVSIIITNLEAQIEYVNPKFTQFTGYALAEVLGQNPRLLQSGTTTSEDYKKLWETITAGEEWRGEFRNKKKNGEFYWEFATISPIKNASGQIIHYLAVKEDITAKKSFEAQILRAQRMESIGILAAGIAHDLNNALSPILLSIEYLRKLIQDENGRRTLGIIERNATRGADIVKQVLTFSRGVEGEKEEVQIRNLMREILKVINETFPKSIRPNFEISRELWLITGNITSLLQMLLNLCMNAQDAMPNGGVLGVTAKNCVLDESVAKTHLDAKPGQYIVLAISDTGTGIPPKIMDKIFNPFFTTKPPGKGTGLGLSTVHSIVKNHRGFINVCSEVGKGTTFTIYLPVVDIECVPSNPLLENKNERVSR